MNLSHILFFSPTDISEIATIMKNLKNKIPLGLDQVSVRTLKYLFSETETTISYNLTTTIFFSGYSLKVFKTAVGAALFENGHRHKMSYYRHI